MWLPHSRVNKQSMEYYVARKNHLYEVFFFNLGEGIGYNIKFKGAGYKI